LPRTLLSIDRNIWLVEGSIVDFYGFPYPTRSVVIRIADRDLWIWSPVALDPQMKDEIDALGNVTHLVSPNKIHHLYLQDWKRVYPQARIWGPASTIRKRKDLAFEAPLQDSSPPEWDGEIEQAWFR